MDPLLSAADALLIAEVFGPGGAAIDWTKLTHKHTHTATAGAHQAYTWFNISGAGFLEVILLHSGTRNFTLQVDGGPIESYTFEGFTSPYITQNSVIMRRPFSTSLILKADAAPSSAENAIAYLRSGATDKGFNHKDWTPVLAREGTAGAHYSNTHVDIAGKGYLIGLYGPGSWSYQIDGGPIRTVTHAEQRENSYLGYLRYNTSLKVACSNVPSASVFAQYFSDP